MLELGLAFSAVRSPHAQRSEDGKFDDVEPSAGTIADPKTAKMIDRGKGFMKMPMAASVGMTRTSAMLAMSTIGLGRLDHIRRR